MTAIPGCEIYIDGASRGNPGLASIGVYLKAGPGSSAHSFFRYIGETTNNVAEYFALIYGLDEAWLLGYRSIKVNTDSELLARQISGQYKVREPSLKLLHNYSNYLIARFHSFGISHIPRELNAHADRLANQAIDEYLSKKAH